MSQQDPNSIPLERLNILAGQEGVRTVHRLGAKVQSQQSLLKAGSTACACGGRPTRRVKPICVGPARRATWIFLHQHAVCKSSPDWNSAPIKMSQSKTLQRTTCSQTSLLKPNKIQLQMEIEAGYQSIQSSTCLHASSIHSCLPSLEGDVQICPPRSCCLRKHNNTQTIDFFQRGLFISGM
jgi:hypothetical protein